MRWTTKNEQNKLLDIFLFVVPSFSRYAPPYGATVPVQTPIRVDMRMQAVKLMAAVHGCAVT